MTALSLQSAGGEGAGLLNPTIYGQEHATAFTDVAPMPTPGDGARGLRQRREPHRGLIYSVRTFNQDSSLKLAKGWDDVTGVGSPNQNFLFSLGK